MKYYIYVRGMKIPVSADLYKAYWQLVNHEKYLERQSRKYQVYPFSLFDREEISFEEMLADERIDIEKLVETNLLLEKLRRALLTLTDTEFDIITSLYFKETSIREVARQQAMSPTSLFRLRNKILDYLKNFLEK